MPIPVEFFSVWAEYPEGWPMCAFCCLPVLDAHLTCGRWCCDEAQARLLYAAVANRIRVDSDLGRTLAYLVSELRTRTPSGPQKGGK